MPKDKKILISSDLISKFKKTFTSHQLFTHLYSTFKISVKTISVYDYNLAAFLNLDKTRKIIRQKQDMFVQLISVKIITQFQNIRNTKRKQSHKLQINICELQKFVEIFAERKQYFDIYCKSLQNILSRFSIKIQEVKSIQESVLKMKNYLISFSQKLLFLINHYQSKIPNCFTKNLSEDLAILLRQNINFPQHNSTIQNHNQEKNSKQKESQQDLQQTQQKICSMKQKNIQKIGSSDVQNKKTVQEYQKQIKMLKQKYTQLNCKTEFNQNNQFKQLRQKTSSISIFNYSNAKKPNKNIFHQTLQQMETQYFKNKNEVQTAPSEMKFSIRLTRQIKKSDNLITSYNIFDRTNSIPSFFKNQACNIGNNTLNDNYLYQNNNKNDFLGRKNSSFLKKRSSKNSSFRLQDTYLVKKPNNSVYRQSNFTVQSDKRKSEQKRVSINQGRNSYLKKHNTKKLSMIRVSHTEGNQQFQNKQNNNNLQINDSNQYQQFQNKKEVLQISLQLEKQDYDEEQLRKKFKQDKSKKNRRKGFSKKQIDCSECSNDQIPSSKQIKRPSIWDQSDKKQRNFNRTSFFRTSGYVPKKTVQKVGKTRYFNLNRKKLDSESKQLNSDNNIEIGTKKTIKSKFMQKQRLRKQNNLKGSDFAVTIKDCYELFTEVQLQVKKDFQQEYPSYITDLMRQKYDLQFKRNNNEQEFQELQFKNYKAKFKVMESEVAFRTKNLNYAAEDCNLVDFQKKVSKSFNQLGQKELKSKDNCNKDFLDLQTFI